MDTLLLNLKLIYNALHLPLFLYRQGSLSETFPDQAAAYPVPIPYLEKIILQAEIPPYISTSLSSLYGIVPLSVREESSQYYLIVGPVSQLPYTRNDFHQLFREYHVAEDDQENFVAFFQSIPHHLPSELEHILTMICHFLNPHADINYSAEAFLQQFQRVKPDNLLSASIRNVYEQTSISQLNHSLEYEKIFTDIVEHGSVEKISQLPSLISDMNAGTLAQTPLRSQKNLQIAMITLLTRAAIRGGLGDQLAFQLSDQYIQAVETASSHLELSTLSNNAVLSFTTQVANIRKSHIANADMNQIISYIRNHPSEDLTVSRIAEIFGYNSSYLSTRFKSKLGFGLSSFIYRTKLEEARQLLAYTNKSLLEISEYLCFTDQSHFQNKFRQQYGMTPLQYRKENQKS